MMMSQHICILSMFLVLPVALSVSWKSRNFDDTPVPSGALPWQVILKKRASDDLLCGGSVISSIWVLTAAHCTYGLNSVFLIFGTIDIKKFSISMTSKTLILHPQYNPDNLNNDVSLIKLPYALVFSSTIEPIFLVTSSQSGNSFVGTNALIAGYGYREDENLEFSDILLSATVDIIDNTKCVAEFGNEVVIDSTLCAIGANGSNQSICPGDSGGPLVTLNSDGNFYQIGINSFMAEDACTEGFPSGYARLTSFIDFIESTTGLDSKKKWLLRNGGNKCNFFQRRSTRNKLFLSACNLRRDSL